MIHRIPVSYTHLEREKQLKACQKNYKDAKTELQLELDHYVDEVRQEMNRHKQLIEEQKRELRQAQDAELNGKGADVATIRKYDERLAEIKEELRYISEHRNQVAYYEKDKQELFDKEPAMRRDVYKRQVCTCLNLVKPYRGMWLP